MRTLPWSDGSAKQHPYLQRAQVSFPARRRPAPGANPILAFDGRRDHAAVPHHGGAPGLPAGGRHRPVDLNPVMLRSAGEGLVVLDALVERW
jgi:hypothetical protein